MAKRIRETDVFLVVVAIVVGLPLVMLWWLYSVVGLWGLIAIAVAVTGAAIWWWRKHDADEAPRSEVPVGAPPVEMRDWSGERLTDTQFSALLAASNDRHIYDRQSNWRDACDDNSFHERTLSSLEMRGLLNGDGRGRYRLTEDGHDLLIQHDYEPGSAWHPPHWASLKIKYRDAGDEVTERQVDVFDLDRYRFYGYCHLRNGEARTFAIANVLNASDAKTGEDIDDVGSWLSARAVRH